MSEVLSATAFASVYERRRSAPAVLDESID
jgi:hypothetical protein